MDLTNFHCFYFDLSRHLLEGLEFLVMEEKLALVTEVFAGSLAKVMRLAGQLVELLVKKMVAVEELFAPWLHRLELTYPKVEVV